MPPRQKHNEIEPAVGSPSLSILIPVYSSKHLVSRLVEKLIDIFDGTSHTAYLKEVLLVNDSPHDLETTKLLEQIAQDGRIPVRVINNPVNLGFVGSVNNGLSLTDPQSDVLILNSDTFPLPGFLDQLYEQVTSLRENQVRWGSLTPVSNHATIASVPKMAIEYKTYPGISSPELMAKICNFLFDGQEALLEAPVGVGSCMLMSREALSEIGSLSMEFSPGYGEEVDWCLRAGAGGYQHYLLPKIFVHHDGAGSFNEARQRLVEEHGRLISSKYPAFNHCVQRYVADGHNNRFHHAIAPFADLLASVRSPNISIQLLPHKHSSTFNSIKTFLATVSDEAASKHDLSIVSISPRKVSGQTFFELAIDNKHFYSLSLDMFYFLFRSLFELQLISVESAVLHHIDGWEPEILEDLLALLETRTDNNSVVVHDHFLLCKEHRLLYNDEIACGAPSDAESFFCRTCKHGDTVIGHRAYSLQLMDRFKRIVLMSRTSEKLLLSVFPELAAKCMIEPPLRVIKLPSITENSKVADVFEMKRLALIHIGGPDQSQGSQRFLDLFNSHVGKFDWFYLGQNNVLAENQYMAQIFSESSLNDSGIWPAFVVINCLWPEAFNFNLHKALRAGLPVLTTEESGDVAALIEELGAGKVFKTHRDLLEYLSSPVAALIREAVKLQPSCSYQVNPQALGELMVANR